MTNILPAPKMRPSEPALSEHVDDNGLPALEGEGPERRERGRVGLERARGDVRARLQLQGPAAHMEEVGELVETPGQ